MTTYVSKAKEKLFASDQVWIATALLHKENPKRNDFSFQEIWERAQEEGFIDRTKSTFYVHANQHCVANRTPNPGNHRMLTETSSGRRRLYKNGDLCNPGRTGKSIPKAGEIPAKYHYLLDWYSGWNKQPTLIPTLRDPLLRLKGSGRDLWKDEHADEYVRRLREGWE